MESKDRVLIVDAGNTRIKAALFFNDELIEMRRFAKNEALIFSKWVSDLENPPLFISSVLSEDDLSIFMEDIPNATIFNLSMKVPVEIGYETPKTLGLDRLANACAIQSLQKEGPKVAIDMGTCIKFDFVNKDGVYLGGSISPGLQMRFSALNHFTGKLPHIEAVETTKYLGVDSESSIRVGVIEGIQGELNHFISRYLQDYQGLTFFVTGGDAKFFDFPTKNNIFANENLTQIGLHKIYLLNA